jgi:uncharacterized protein (DUF58 family)
MVGGLFGILLQVLFIAFKLNGTIDWSWWVVLLPSIITAVWVLLWFVIGIAFVLVVAGQKRPTSVRRRHVRRS